MADSDLMSRLEQARDAMSQRYMEMRQNLLQAVGQRPFDTQKLPERQQLASYLLDEQNPQAWQQLLTAHGWDERDPMNVPTAVLDYAQRGQRLKDKYPDMVAAFHGQPQEGDVNGGAA